MRNGNARTVRSRQDTFYSNGGHEAWFWPFLTPNNLVVHGQKHKVWVLVFLVRTSGTCWDQIWADLAKFSSLHQNRIRQSISIYMTLLGVKFDVISFYDVIYWTERQWSVLAFKLLKTEPFLWKIYLSFMHSFWNFPHHGRSNRKQTVENKGSNVLFGMIK